jgi:hypothetical protein
MSTAITRGRGLFRFSQGVGKVSLNMSAVRTILVALHILITMRIMALSHFAEPVGIVEVAYFGCMVLYLLYRVVVRAFNRDLKFNSVELYLMIIALLPVQAAIACKLQFGQPPIWGFLVFKDFYLFIGALLLYNMLRKGIVNLQEVERAFVLAAWLSVLYFYGASLFTSPQAYKTTQLAGAQEGKGSGAYYRFNMAIVFFGAIYYTAKAFMHKRYMLLVPALFFAAYAVFFRLDRTMMAVMLLSMALAALFHAPLKEVARFALLSVLPAIGLVILAALLVPDVIQQYYDMFANAISTLTSDTVDPDASVARVYEFKIAERYIERNPWIGSGRVSSNWVEGGFEHFFGFFYPSDIGVWGQIFMFGYLGAFLVYAQFLVALGIVLRIKAKDDVLLATLKFFLLALFLDSLTNGFLVVYAAQSITVIFLLHWYLTKERAEAAALRS